MGTAAGESAEGIDIVTPWCMICCVTALIQWSTDHRITVSMSGSDRKYSGNRTHKIYIHQISEVVKK